MSVRKALTSHFKEVFEGTAPGADGTWFVQGGEALEETLSALSAEEASIKPTPGMSSIAAHVLHMTHYLQMSNANGRGQEFAADWQGSWRKQTVSADEWREAVDNLRVQKQLLLNLMSQEDIAENDDAVFGAIANIAHAAFHLGAIRQLFVWVKSSD